MLKKVHLIDVVNDRIEKEANIVLEGIRIVDIFYQDRKYKTDHYDVVDLAGFCYAQRNAPLEYYSSPG